MQFFNGLVRSGRKNALCKKVKCTLALYAVVACSFVTVSPEFAW